MERHFTSSDGVDIAYDDLGSGAVVVLCHGLAAAAVQFKADAQYLAGRGFRVLVPDLRGHGRSGLPAGGTADFSIRRLAADMDEMLADAGASKVHWVGNSLGGIVALEMLEAQRLKTLATFGTSYSLQLPRVGAHRLVPLGYRLFGAKRIGAMTAWGVSKERTARRIIAGMVERARPEVTAALADVLTRYDLVDRGVAAHVPILMLRGGRDAQINAALGPTLRAMQGRPNFTLIEMKAGGHCLNLDVPEPFRAALLAFWTQPA